MKLQTQVNEQNKKLNDSDNNGGVGKKKFGRKTPDNPNFTRRTTDQYCWTHGGCQHLGKDCTRKARGHIDDATFEDKKGGSLDFCN